MIPDLVLIVAMYVIFRAIELFAHEMGDTRATARGKSLIYFFALIVIAVAIFAAGDTIMKGQWVGQKTAPFLNQ